MARYAVVDAGRIVSEREINDINSYPPHKVAARDEKGDGGPVLRLIETEGSGEIKTRIVELNRVREVFTDRPLDQIKADLLRQIDDRAESERLKYITSGSGKAMSYQEKLAEARLYLDDPENTSAEEVPILAAEALVRGITLEQVVTLVHSTYLAYKAIESQINSAAIAGKIAVEAAETASAARAAYQEIDWTIA